MGLASFLGGPASIGGAGSGFGDESSDLLQSRASVGDVSLASPFTFTGSGSSSQSTGAPAWMIAAGLAVVGVLALGLLRRGR